MRNGAIERADGEACASAVVGTRWGVVGLVESGGAVVFLMLGDDEESVGEVLDEHFTVARRGEPAARLAREVARRIETGQGLDGIPYEASGTEFQETVWRELARIPRGEAVTYAELARRLERPSAVRAVGSACAATPVALFVPCHRVVPSDGTVGGYRWGRSRKEAILADEGVTGAMLAERWYRT